MFRFASHGGNCALSSDKYGHTGGVSQYTLPFCLFETKL